MTDPNHITRQQLADLIGARAPSYVNELEKNGRAVRAPDGKLWLKTESLAAYHAGKDPSRQGVADRHAAARSAVAGQANQQQKTALAPVNNEEVATKSVAGEISPQKSQQYQNPDQETEAGDDQGRYNFQTSKAKREHFAAMEAQASYLKQMKELMDASEVRAVLAEILTVLRTSMEGLAYNMAPILAATNDEATIKSTLGAEIEHALKTASEALAKLGRGEM